MSSHFYVKDITDENNYDFNLHSKASSLKLKLVLNIFQALKVDHSSEGGKYLRM